MWLYRNNVPRIDLDSYRFGPAFLPNFLLESIEIF